MKGMRLAWSLGMLALAASSMGQDDVADAYRAIASPLRTPDDLAELIRDAGTRRLVLLGEATHGTREFYTWRAEISKRLIADHGFRFVAVEGDWASLWRLNRYITQPADAGPGATDILRGFDRWPRWMWANREFAEFAEWLRDHNRGLGIGDDLLRFPPPGERPEALIRGLGHRAVGVVHVPGQDPRAGNVPTRPAARYDALLFIESTTALHPLHDREDGK